MNGFLPTLKSCELLFTTLSLCLYHISIDITIISLLINFIHSRLRSIVISPSVRMALKLHQDHFVENFGEHPQSLYERISSYQSGIFISHEANISKMIKIQLLNLQNDSGWREAIIDNVCFLTFECIIIFVGLIILEIIYLVHL